MNKSIKHQLFFPHPPESVWEYLTNADLMELWLMKNDFEPIIGRDFQFRTNPIPAMDFDGISYCKVLEIEPFKKLTYSWKGGPGNGVFTLDSLVVWQLVPKDNGTELLLEHTGFPEAGNIMMYNGMNAGWLKNMHKIADRLNAEKDGTTSI